MRGSVRKRGNRWTAIYDEARADDGRRVQRWKSGFHTKKAAERFLATTVASLGDGSYVQPSKTTLGAYLESWLDERESLGDIRPSTLKRYRELVRGQLAPRLGHLPVQAVKRAHLLALYRDLREGGEGRKPLAASTVAMLHAVVHRALADAVASDLVVRNVAATVRGPRAASRRAQAWSPRELRRFLDHVAGDRLAALWRVAAMTGMRRGELLGLCWRCVDLDGGRLTVEQQLVVVRGGVGFGPPKTERSRRTVALDEGTVAALHAHRDAQQLERAFLAAAYVDKDLVFAREDGEPLYPQRISEAFERHARQAGLPHIRLHGLRHTHATLALTSGVPVHVVAARLGDRPETLLAVYSHLLPTSDAEAAVRVAALV